MATSSETTKDTPKTTKLTIEDARDKRTLSNFDSHPHHHIGPPQIQRRITNYHQDGQPYADSSSNYIENYSGGYNKDYAFGGYQKPQQNYQPAYTVENSQYVGGYQQQQYVEAPEPIIEIIIKESNESLPGPKALPYQTPKKKKEQVQVFYVKYNKDEKKGLIIDDPIPGKKVQVIFGQKNFFFFIILHLFFDFPL